MPEQTAYNTGNPFKVIKMVKSDTKRSYCFKQAIIRKEKVNDFFSSSKS